ncbi:MAG: glycosyltransferase family 39 protein [Planctomycetia bacterium]|nr:glycosyltransferase family 39 protein [Planctomycetia bacterium]
MTARPGLALPAILALAIVVHLVWKQPTEPYFSGDETRHVMTGVFVRDAIRDGGYRSPRAYAERYYAQYPCLGLLVWPQGFHALEGAAMLVFGPELETGRGLVLAYLLVALAYFHSLVRRTHGATTAAVAATLLFLSREVFVNSRAVMLEVPTLACVLAAIVHFERYLADTKRRDLIAFAVGVVAAGLHRYDAVFLAPLFLLRLAMEGRLRLIVTRPVLLATVTILVALAPFYWLAYQTIGQQHALAASSGSNPDVVRHGWDRLTYYPLSLEFQLGLVGTLSAITGLVLSFRNGQRAKSRTYWALAIVVYACFAALSEQETRHTIYWLPAWCVWTAETALEPLRRFGRKWWTLAVAVVVVGSVGCWTLRQVVPWVRGYADAAEYVLANTDGPGIVLFDGHFDGTFIHSLRVRDADRRLWVARGDKLLYAVRSDPGAGYVEWTKSEREIADLLTRLAPEFLVVEEPPLKHVLPAQVMLRKVLTDRIDLFERATELPIRNNNIEWMDGARLVVYRLRNRPAGPRTLNMPMLWGGRDLTIDLPARR